jgi:antitoxin component YwqK of YwqJK toxin-antitoxin module
LMKRYNYDKGEMDGLCESWDNTGYLVEKNEYILGIIF